MRWYNRAEKNWLIISKIVSKPKSKGYGFHLENSSQKKRSFGEKVIMTLPSLP